MFELMLSGFIIYVIYRIITMGNRSSDYDITQVGNLWYVYLRYFGYDPIATFEDYEEARRYVETEVKRRNK